MRCPLFLTAEMYFVYFDFLSVPCCWPFPPPSSFLVSVVSLDLIYCCVCSFRPRSFFFRYQLCARWWVCESCLIYSSVKRSPGQESSTGYYSVNVCLCGFVREVFWYMRAKRKSSSYLWSKTGLRLRCHLIHFFSILVISSLTWLQAFEAETFSFTSAFLSVKKTTKKTPSLNSMFHSFAVPLLLE